MVNRREVLQAGLVFVAAAVPSGLEAGVPVKVVKLDVTRAEMVAAAKRGAAAAQAQQSAPAEAQTATGAAKDAATDAATTAAKNEAQGRLGRIGGALGGAFGGRVNQGRESVMSGVRDLSIDPADGVPVIIAETVRDNGGRTAVHIGPEQDAKNLIDSIKASGLDDVSVLVVDVDHVWGKHDKNVAQAAAKILGQYEDKGAPLVLIYSASDPSKVLLAENSATITAEQLNVLKSGTAPVPAAPTAPVSTGPQQPEGNTRRKRTSDSGEGGPASNFG